MQYLSALAAGLVALPALTMAAYDPSNMPAKTDAAHGQFGYNDCTKRYGASSSKGHCQNAFINSVQDFCLWAPHKTTTIGESEAREIAYCTKSGYGTRLIPEGTIKGAHFLKTPSYVQVTGVGDLTKINIAAKDEGGELDPHGATGAGNPVGGVVFTRAFTGKWQQLTEWQNFMSYNEFCFRACQGDNAKEWCPHIYDVMGCYWNEPANYDKGVFEDCEGTEGEWPGVYHGSTFYQGQHPTPRAQTAGKSSKCHRYSGIETGKAKVAPQNKLAAMATPLGQLVDGVEKVVGDVL